MYVCLCKAVTEEDLRFHAECVGADFERIKERCGVATDCGSCRFKAERIVREAEPKAALETAAG
jgi:bacterioferritin-associated ferredoxin